MRYIGEKPSGTDAVKLPAGTAEQRPNSAVTGHFRVNTETSLPEWYDGTKWRSTEPSSTPFIFSATGVIASGVATTLQLSLADAADTISVRYFDNGTVLTTDTGVTVTNNSATVTVPSQVYNLSAGTEISIQVFNDGSTTLSNSINKTLTTLPTGGTLTTSGSYFIHTFNSSGTFTVPAGLTLSDVEYLVVAGGGGGGFYFQYIQTFIPPYTYIYGYYYGGGGGGGGYRSSVAGELSGRNSSAESTLTLTPQSYNVVVGAGGAGGTSSGQQGGDGSSSSFDTITSIGGGGGGAGNYSAGRNGGCGGGGGGPNKVKGSGTTGQGFDGANGATMAGGGGGGAGGAAGGGGTPGVGLSSSITGSSVTLAGGGAGTNGTLNGSANSGYGGRHNAGSGGSGVVIIRYSL